MVRRFKPSRREVKAAIEFYKPYQGGMMPLPEEITSNPEIYRSWRCWWTFNGRKLNVTQYTCGNPATLYQLSKAAPGYSQSPSVKVYLCDHHRDKLKDTGYNVTLVTCTPGPEAA